ncbi:MAG: HAMP domain-containing sensor histidine kinase [candidate division FCPU426 bacterium]
MNRMQHEINGRTLNNLILFVRKHRPQELPRLLEGYNADEIGDQHEWVPVEVRNQLFARAETIFGKTDILEEVGREAFTLHSLGIVEWLVRMEPDLSQLVHLSAKYASLFSSLTDIRIRHLRGKELLIERSEPGLVRGSCFYLRGLMLGLLELFERRGCTISESQCCVPLWEKGVINGSRFHLREGRVWREEVKSGRQEDLGPVPETGTFAYEGTTYGAPSCLCRFHWKRGPGWWRRWTRSFRQQRRWLEIMQHNLLHEYELVENRNRKLRQNQHILQNLVQQKSDLTRTLERKVTDRTLELEDLVKQLQELDDMKSYFLTLTSHELRTPLTIIKCALNLILTEGNRLSPERFLRYLQMARTNADHLQLLIANLLDLSRLESGQMKLEIEPVDLIRLMRESAEQFRDLAERRDLRLTTAFPPALQDIEADPARLKQIIDNLLSNAIKFTPPKGEIRIALECSEDQVLVEIVDTGIGIEPWESERIFHKFQQSERSLTREASGIGLGLAIVKELVELHEGQVWVESEKGEGSRFFVQLPLSGPKNPKHFVRRSAMAGGNSPMVLESH